MNPRVAFSVKNRLTSDPGAGNLGVDLTFKSLDDFEPDRVVQNVKPLKDLMELRTKLSDLIGSLQGNEKLERLLHDVMGNTEKLEQLKQELAETSPE
jgi:type VI secretion system protein ImpB